MLSPLQLLMVLMLSYSSSAVHNNATESGHPQLAQDDPDEAGEDHVNKASHGGRRLADAERNGPNQNQVQCKELRSTKLISDGQCSSVSPIKELLCTGECLPAHLESNWITGGKRFWSRHDAQDWRCVTDRSRTQRVRLRCRDGSSRTYKVNVVTSCRCKRFTRQQNDSGRQDSAAQGPRKTSDRSSSPEGFTDN